MVERGRLLARRGLTPADLWGEDGESLHHLYEGERAGRAYRDYVALGPSRSVRLLAEIYVEKEKEWEAAREAGRERDVTKPPTVSERTLMQWNIDWDWNARSKQEDREAIELQREIDKEARVREIAEWEGRRKQLREKEWALAETMIAKAETMLRFPLTTQEITGANGEVTVVIPAKWTQGTAVQLIQAASQLARGAAELPVGEEVVVNELPDVERLAAIMGFLEQVSKIGDRGGIESRGDESVVALLPQGTDSAGGGIDSAGGTDVGAGGNGEEPGRD